MTQTVAPMRWLALALCLAFWTACTSVRAADVVLENPRIRLAITPSGQWRSVQDRRGGVELCPKSSGPVATATVRGAVRAANAAALAGSRLTLGLAGSDTRLVYQVESSPRWISFRLVEAAGARPSHVTLLRLPVTIGQHVGPRLTGAWDARFGVCLRGLNLQTDGTAARRAGYAELSATTQDAPGPKLEGAGVAVLAGSPDELRDDLGALANVVAGPNGVPLNDERGVPSRCLPLARQSYWFLAFGEKDADRVAELCRQSGIRQVMLMSGAWCRTVGHYSLNTSYYPDGRESLRRTVARLHRDGILVGMHSFASKISKTDAYVTPVPDRRFWVDRRAELDAAVDAVADTLVTRSDLRQWPGSSVASQKLWEGGVEKHSEVIVDDEIIRYREIGPPGRWNTFLGCQRGSYGTRAAPHKAQNALRHYGIDGCINGYIVDQDTPLLDEAIGRLADVFNACDFDMIYFDGGEDVDTRRFNYYASKCQAAALRKFRKRPIVHMGTIMTHGVWPSFTRSGTLDTYLNTLNGHILAGGKIDTWPTVRDHINGSVRYMQSVADDMVPGELGWFGVWPKGRHTDGLQLDEIEYLMTKSAAYNAPISLETSFLEMSSHPLTPGILDIVRLYEDLRRRGPLEAEAAKRLQVAGKDFCLIVSESNGDKPPAHHWIEVKRAANVAGQSGLRAMIGVAPRGAAAFVWHYLGREGRLELAGSAVNAHAIDGNRLAVESRGETRCVTVGGRRTTLFFAGQSADDAAAALAAARFVATPASPGGKAP